ncbi:efflux transporter outer membrane subunit [Uliginosibacterium sp. sgz301328]|uniref:efflux transporter outer membrane subunit n=1 Tax=Uliginosibacterium sp. sgz301328 TaxID=3243764 RepID=UPI00359ECBFA
MKSRNLWPAMAMLFLAAGCANMRGLAPENELTDIHSLSADKSLAGARLSATAWPATDWWRQLGDAQMDAVISEALQGNPDLAIADARVRQAAAESLGADAARYPKIDAKGSLPGAQIPEGVMPELGGNYATMKMLSVGGSYTFDLWGGERAAWESALGAQRATEIDARAARLTISTSVASAYSALAYAFQSHDIALADLDRANKLLDLTRQRVDAGVDSVAQLRQAESVSASAEQKVAQTEQEIESSRTQLSVLLGKGPDRGRDIQRPQALHASELALPDNLPAELLGRRPDIVAARWRVESARRGIDAAKAQFYPNVNLSATLGLLSVHTADLFQASSRFALVTPAISLPLFDGGRLRANLAGRDAQYDLAVAQYNKTLVGALNQVADSLSRLRSLQTQESAQRRALSSAQQAFDLSMQRYRNGVGAYLEVLIVQQSLHLAEDRMADIQTRQIETSIELIRALGGGYRAEQPVPTATASTK